MAAGFCDSVLRAIFVIREIDQLQGSGSKSTRGNSATCALRNSGIERVSICYRIVVTEADDQLMNLRTIRPNAKNCKVTRLFASLAFSTTHQQYPTYVNIMLLLTGRCWGALRGTCQQKHFLLTFHCRKECKAVASNSETSVSVFPR